MRGYLSGGWWFLRVSCSCVLLVLLLPFPFVSVEAMAMVGFLRVLGGKSAFFVWAGTCGSWLDLPLPWLCFRFLYLRHSWRGVILGMP